MSRFEDPTYMAESKADLLRYVLTGRLPDTWKNVPTGAIAPPGRITFKDWELKAMCDAMKKAGPRGYWIKHLPRDFPRTQGHLKNKVAYEGGRELFLRKYGDL
jgi:hypothetical protein